jgi:hypothetical protein
VKVEKAEIESLVFDPQNARTHSEENLEAIKRSLTRFGQQKLVVVDADGVVLAGNGTMTAARALGWTHLSVHRSELRGSEARAFAIADNRTAELARWDYEVLARQIPILTSEGIDALDMGWGEAELRNILGANWSPPPVEEGLDTFDPNADGPDAEGKHTVVFTAAQWAVLAARLEATNSKEMATRIFELVAPEPPPAAAPVEKAARGKKK